MLRAWAMRLAGLFRRDERELSDELECHLQMHIDDNVRRGMTQQEARREATLKLGGVEPTKEAYRDARTIPVLENALRDVRFALRQLRKNPGFTCTAILMLALGVCASVAIFAFVDATLIKPLPYRDPARLVGVFERVAMIPQSNLSYLDYLDWKKFNKTFRSLEAYEHLGFILSTPEGAQPARGARVSDGFFRTLGVNMALGRDFYEGEDLPAAPRTVILSYAAWQKRFGGKTDVLGQTVTLDGAANAIVGVLPPEFHFAPAEPAEYWTALHAGNSCELRRSCHNLYGIGRLNDGATLETASAEMTLIAQRLEKQYPDSNRGQGANVLPLTEAIAGNMRPLLLVLLGGAGLLLLIAGVNVSSLLLVRSEGRKREMAVRSALGASRYRLTAQFVTEGLVLAAAGCILGLLSAQGTMQLLLALIPADMLESASYLRGLGLNIRVVAFAGVVSALAAVLFSVTPSLHFSLSEMRTGLTEGSRGSAGNTWRRIGSKLVVVELALAMVLLVGAGLLGQSLFRLLHVDLGFQPDRLATISIAAPDVKNPQQVALARRIVNRISILPGVKSAAIGNVLPVSFNGNTTWIRVVGRPYHGEHNEVNQRDVSSEYFTTLRAKLLRGRYFNDAEDESKPGVAVINQTLARQYFGGADPIGQRIGDTSLDAKSIVEVIGVVDDIKEGGLDSEIWPAVYYPFNQNPDNYYSLVVRTSQAEQAMLPTLDAAIRRLDPGLATMGTATMNERINGSPSAYLHRSSAWLVGGFAVLALVLGVLGLYGVVEYSVSQRTREIGVRMALGAESGAVYRMILKEAGGLTAVGIAAGLVCSLGATATMRGLLFGVASWDVTTLAGVAVVLGVSAMLASYLPARRAASVNPVVALRSE